MFPGSTVRPPLQAREGPNSAGRVKAATEVTQKQTVEEKKKKIKKKKKKKKTTTVAASAVAGTSTVGKPAPAQLRGPTTRGITSAAAAVTTES